MKTLIQKQIATVVLATISMTTMVACSSQSSNTGSGNAAASAAGLTNTAGQAMTNCSQSNAAISDFSMNLESAPMSTTFAESNYIRMHFNSFPTFTNPKATLTVWAYGTDQYGNYTTMTQVPFTIEKYSGASSFSVINSTNTYALTWSAISSLATSNGISNSSAATALASMDLVVNISSVPSSTVLEVALYSNGVGTSSAPASADRSLQALIPAFLANPNDYITTHNNTLLQLHPFYSLMNSGNSEAQFAQLGANLCF